MGLQFYFGPSGAGKSRKIYEQIIERAMEEPNRNFLIIVPDQFTMQTQKDLVMLSKCGGIMNIDVLSFGRLGHRILEEVGWEKTPVLDDVGKCLVLQRVAGGMKDELSALGGFLNRQGYIHEVKSAISEFMQYGISVKDMDRLIEFAQNRGALSWKLKDLKALYEGFENYIKDHFITTEEKLDVLSRSLSKSGILPDSVVVFDGFTGFTPIQNRLIRDLMCVCGEVIITLTLGEGENPYEMDGEQRLFHLTKKTVADLTKLAQSVNVCRREDVFVSGEEKHRFTNAPALAHLERNLFRYPSEVYGQEQEEIRIFAAFSPAEEVRQVGLEICRLIRSEGLAYRDIAVITGDLESYAPYVRTEFGRMELPCFVDSTRGLRLNPMIEYIKSALSLYEEDFSYRSVFHYLRSGLADFTPEEVDCLENYCIRTGIHGLSRWSRPFVYKQKLTGSVEEQEAELSALNRMRERLLAQVAMLRTCGRGSAGASAGASEGAGASAGVGASASEGVGANARAGVCNKATAREYVDALYDFLVENRVQDKLLAYQSRFEQSGDAVREAEYAQIYRLVIALLEQIYDMLGDEVISRKEFLEVCEAGFAEIQVGTIPQNVDHIIVGDMERTRLRQVKVLFFLGVNDGNIPKNVSKGGIISDMDREFLKESELELAPSPRQQMYIQRLYLYLNMTKPSMRLYLSFPKVDSAGKSVRPAYLIDTVQQMFPTLAVDYPENRPVTEQMVSMAQGRTLLAEGLRTYVDGTLPREDLQTFYTIYQVYGGAEQLAIRTQLTEAAFKRYQEENLSKMVAGLLYGNQLVNSVTRLETFAACCYKHFLQYGLSLREREEFGFESVDMGNVFHAVLEQFGGRLEEGGYTWFDFPEEFGARAVRESLISYAAVYGETVLYSNARNEYAITRMERILTRTVLTLQEHLKQGKYYPAAYEFSFQEADGLASVNVALSDDERIRLQGRIDRIDTSEDEEHVYVKVIDYKSGDKKFDLLSFYYGLQLQLVVYMNAAVEAQRREHPDKEIVPAAILYYHVTDPLVESDKELSEQELNSKIMDALRMNGVVNADMEIVAGLDRSMGEKSRIIPVAVKNGAFTGSSDVYDREQLEVLSRFVTCKIKEIGHSLLAGKIAKNPYQKGQDHACKYCSYRKVCGYDETIPGYEKRELENYSEEEIFAFMKETI